MMLTKFTFLHMTTFDHFHFRRWVECPTEADIQRNLIHNTKNEGQEKRRIDELAKKKSYNLLASLAC